MPQEPKIDISAGLVERPKVKTGTVDISAGLEDAKPEKGETITPEERARRERLGKQPLTDMTKLRKQVVGGGNVLTTGLVPPEPISEEISRFAGIPSPMMQRAAIESEVSKGARPLKAGLMEFLAGVQQSVAGGASGATSPAGLAMLHPATAPMGAAAFTAESAGVLGEGIGEAMDDPSRIMQPATAEKLLGGAGGVLGAGMGMRPGAVRGAAQATRETASAAGEVARAGAQHGLGIDARLTAREVAARKAQIESDASAHQVKLFETMLDNAKKVAETEGVHKQAVFENLLQRAKTASENQARWEAQQRARSAKVAEQEALLAERSAIESGLNQKAMAQRDAVRVKEQEVKADLDARYAEIRNAVGEQPLNTEPVINAVKQADAIIQGSPENIRIFREIMEASGAADLGQASVFRGAGMQGRVSFADMPPGFDPARISSESRPLYPRALQEANAQLTFSDAHGFYSELGRKMHAGNLPGDVYRALKHVHEQIGAQLQAATDRAGVGNQFRQAQADWSRYQHTFHDMRSMSIGGSPLARVFRAPDPAYASAPITGKTSARALQMMKDYGIDTGLATQILADTVRLKHLPTKAKAIPEIRRADKPLPETPMKPAVKVKEAPLAPAEPPRVDPQVLKQQELDAFISKLRNPSHWDALFLSGFGWALLQGKPVLAAGALAHPLGKRLLAKGLEKAREPLTKPTQREVDMANQ